VICVICHILRHGCVYSANSTAVLFLQPEGVRLPGAPPATGLRVTGV